LITEIKKPIEENKIAKINMIFHIESINLLSSSWFDLNFAKVGIKTDEKIIGEIPVIIDGTANKVK
jgi:hypothetical protein